MPHTLSQVKEDAEPLPENLRYLIDNPEYQLTFTPLHTIKTERLVAEPCSLRKRKSLAREEWRKVWASLQHEGQQRPDTRLSSAFADGRCAMQTPVEEVNHYYTTKAPWRARPRSPDGVLSLPSTAASSPSPSPGFRWQMPASKGFGGRARSLDS